jgi:hypothetical protein
MLRRISVCVALLLSLPSVTRADWSLTTADGTEQKHLTVNTWDLMQGLAVTDPSGSLTRLDTRSVVALSSDRHPAAATTAWRLTLRNGDHLFGRPAGISGQSLNYALPELGTIAVPLKVVLAIDSPKGGSVATDETGAADKDVVYLLNGDTLAGIIASVAMDKIQIATGAETGNAATTDIAMDLVRRIQFAGATPPRGVPPLSARLTFLSGTTLTVPLDPKQEGFGWSINDLTVADPGGEKHKISADQIVSIDVLGGRRVSLTELDAAQDEQASFMGTHWPTTIDKTVSGSPLLVARTVYPHGIGVHTQSHVAYDLDGSFDTLTLRAAMDDSAAPRGQADLSIVLDGKVIWQKSSVATATDTPELLHLPIKGGHHLELRADPPKDQAGLDILGRVDWLDPAILRP